MSNIVYEDKQYNKDIKNEYLNEHKPTTQGTISRIFKVSSKSEFDFNKDLFSFNREQIRKLCFLFAPKTEYSSKLNVSLIIKYIDWAIDNEYVKGTNPLRGIPQDWHKQFVNTSIKKYWTDIELEHIISKLHNAQDAVIIMLLFEGVKGTANSEILTLHRKSIDAFNNKLNLFDDVEKKRRTIKVSDKCIRMCEAALKEHEYEKVNGNPKGDMKSSPVSQLVSNDFVVRSSTTKTYHYAEAEKNIVHRRLAMISKELEEQYFSPSHLVYSGMIFMAKELYLANGKLEDYEYNRIFEKYGEDSDPVKNRIKEDVLNLNNIKELYELS